MKRLQSNYKFVVKATFIREFNSKIKTQERIFGIKPLLTCNYLSGEDFKQKYSEIKPTVCIVGNYLGNIVTGLQLCRPGELPAQSARAHDYTDCIAARG